MTTEPLKTVVGVFTRHDLAVCAVDELHRAGFTDEQVGFVTRYEEAHQCEAVTDEETGKAIGGAGIGAAAGGVVGGLLAAGAALLVPGVGSVLGGGVLLVGPGGAGFTTEGLKVPSKEAMKAAIVAQHGGTLRPEEAAEFEPDGEQVGGYLTLLSDFKEFDVINRQGEDLGKVHEFIIDSDTGEVLYVVLSLGGFLGIGSKLHPVPWESLDLSPDEDAFVLAMDRDMLANAPVFEKDELLDFDRDTVARIHTYYGYPDFWAEEAA